MTVFFKNNFSGLQFQWGLSQWQRSLRLFMVLVR